MTKQSKKILIKHGKQVGDRWLFLLPSPFRMRYLPSLPLTANDIADNLDISYQSALRICKNEKPLKAHEMTLLQVIHFGMIPDKAFIKSKIFVHNGKLKCHHLPNYELSTGELLGFVALRMKVLSLTDALAIANEKIKELQGEPKPTNIIKFSDYTKK